MLVLGLTGNIGCGKSSVSNVFIREKIDVVDADIEARRIFEDKVLLQKVFDTFGEGIKNEDNTLNRKALANIVFNDDKQLEILNSLTHPKIKENILEKIEQYRKEGKSIAVIDAALLIEDNYMPNIDKLLLVTCKEDIQIKRIVNRDNCTEEEAISRIKSQMSQEEKAKFADYKIDNSGSIENLEQQVLELIKLLKGE